MTSNNIIPKNTSNTIPKLLKDYEVPIIAVILATGEPQKWLKKIDPRFFSRPDILEVIKEAIKNEDEPSYAVLNHDQKVYEQIIGISKTIEPNNRIQEAKAFEIYINGVQEQIREKMDLLLEQGKYKEARKLLKDLTQIKDIKPITAKELMETEYPPPSWIVPDLIPQGLIIMAGKPKIGKSWIALHIAHRISIGKPVFLAQDKDGNDKFKPSESKVLYFGLEDSERRLKDRLKKIAWQDEISDNLLMLTRLEKLDRGGYETLEGLINEYDLKFIIIDTYGRVKPIGRNSNKYEQEVATLEGLQMLAHEYNISIMLIHHTRKNVKDIDDIFDSVHGSIGIQGTADQIMILERARIDNKLKLTITGRDIPETSIVLNSEINESMAGFYYLGEAEEILISDTRKEIIELLKEKGKLKVSQVAEALGMKYNTAKQTLYRMLDAKQIKRNENYEYYVD